MEEKFNPATIEELTGYTVDEVVAMYEDYGNYSETAEKLAKAEKAIMCLLTERYGSACQFCVHDNKPEAGCQKVNGSGGWCCKNAFWNGYGGIDGEVY